jgi:hypothetical protein
MFQSRREFFYLAAVGAVAAAAVTATRAQQGGLGPDHHEHNDPFDVSGPDAPKFNNKDLLAANQKAIKKDVTRLNDLVQQMKMQLEDKSVKDVLPLDVLRETDEIERLARHVRSLIRG